MDIHHAMIVRASPEQVFAALTRSEELSIWMAAPVMIEPPGQAAVGSIVEFQYGRGPKPEHTRRPLIVQVTGLELQRLVRWQINQPVWPQEQTVPPQVIHWSLLPYETSTLVDLRMEGWLEDDDTFASVSYKWASFMMRLKMYLGDLREIVDMLGTIEQRLREKDAAEG